MNMKFNSRADQAGKRNNLDRLGSMAQTEQELLQLDTERMEQEIRRFEGDGTQEDLIAIQRGISLLQNQVRNKMDSVIENSRKVTQKMVEFEEGAEAAAERARLDAERITVLQGKIRNKSDFEGKIEYIKDKKYDGAAFQDDQFRKMQASDEALQRVIERTKRNVEQALNRGW